MLDYYKVLGVPPGSSVSKIKKAYRKMAKLFHPDTAGSKDTERFHLITTAYKTLIGSIGDKDLFYSDNSHSSFNTFNYREYLAEREDYEGKCLLIIYDLMHSNEDNAVKVYLSMSINHLDFSLSYYLNYKEFMNYGWSLSKELVARGEYYDAILLLEQIIEAEHKHNYFRYFFPEVLKFTLKLLHKKVASSLSIELSIDVWERALEMGFPDKENAFFLQNMAECYKRLGDIGEYQKYLSMVKA